MIMHMTLLADYLYSMHVNCTPLAHLSKVLHDYCQVMLSRYNANKMTVSCAIVNANKVLSCIFEKVAFSNIYSLLFVQNDVPRLLLDNNFHLALTPEQPCTSQYLRFGSSPNN
jgi:2-polyprenyl-3-methyl-5-hydroxy-6-metoxy-1,4-benzoquinol methylase